MKNWPHLATDGYSLYLPFFSNYLSLFIFSPSSLFSLYFFLNFRLLKNVPLNIISKKSLTKNTAMTFIIVNRITRYVLSPSPANSSFIPVILKSEYSGSCLKYIKKLTKWKKKRKKKMRENGKLFSWFSILQRYK